MAPYRYWRRRNYWRKRYRPLRRRRPKRPFRRRFYRRRTTVRKKHFNKYRKRKLKKISVSQWQPASIRKCRIRGVFSLFAAGYGRYSNDYELYRESIVPEKQPGGGGWSTFQLSLGNLYSENERLLNWWTKGNKLHNLCRYQYCTLRFYRQLKTDYVVTYTNKYPFVISKFQFPSTHPERLLMYDRKVVVPSFQTAPHLKKRYIKKKVLPPSEFKNQWFFQSDFCRFPLINITSSACDLTNWFASPLSENNNVTLFSLNTEVFEYKDFKNTSFTTWGYHPKNNYYLYGTKNGSEQPKENEIIYLGNALENKEGETNPKAQTPTSAQGPYGFAKWGNPFYHGYINDLQQIFVSTQQPGAIYTGSPTATAKVTKMSNPMIITCRYNPFKDKGYGNKAYWVKVTEKGTGWGDEPSEDLIIQGFPLWILLWGFEDWTNKLQKTQHLYDSYALVVITKYITPSSKYYVFLSDSFVHGQPPYHADIQNMPLQFYKNWYPCWQYQKEAIEDLLMSGPAVSKLKENIHAHLSYTFHFKWGGNPTTLDNVYDPATQPSYALPNKIQQGPEIENPEKDPTKELYPFDIRRDFITQTAAKRLKKDSTPTTTLFTDGDPIAGEFAPKIQAQTTESPETSDSEEAQETLEQQLQFFRHQRQLLHNRYRQLKTLLKTT